MNRRGFIGTIAAALSTAVLDPERLLWMPGEKLISIPAPPRRWKITGKMERIYMDGFNGEVVLHRGNIEKAILTAAMNPGQSWHWQGLNTAALIATQEFPIYIESLMPPEKDHWISVEGHEFTKTQRREYTRTGTIDESEIVYSHNRIGGW